MNHLKQLRKLRKAMKTYCKLKMRSGDWHAVADAAMDLREIDREIAVRSEKK